MSADATDPETAADAAHLAVLYDRLDALRADAADRLDRTRRSRPGGSPQNLSERDAYAAWYADRLAQLHAVEDRLAFGRLDESTGARTYIGRLGLSDDAHTPLLIDWRAPAAEAFYRATAANPLGVARRRHLLTAGRTLVGVEDEVLDPDAIDPATVVGGGVHGDSALLAAVGAARTGRMADIVATIQAEQDEAIRTDAAGILVVQGGPGTGKTAVALHRAAYLLYTNRDRLSRSGVLLVGPSPVFLRYISRVLPSLGETGVVTATPGTLLPDLETSIRDADPVAAVKGSHRMVSVLRAAVRDRQRVPAAPIALHVEGRTIHLTPQDVADARAAARRTRRPHNEARVVFVREVLARLRRAYAASLGRDDDETERDRLEEDLRAAPDVRREVNLCWMPLTPRRVLADLLADPDRLARAAGDRLTRAERRALCRPSEAAWTVEDVPLLDELAHLLGDDGEAAAALARQRAAERESERRYAAQALRGMGGAAAAMVGADLLADRFADAGPSLTVAERAAVDAGWTFGHLVVDEAQEVSPMLWRALHRRCPSRSMTLVGDVAQASHPAAATSWAAALNPWAAGRWRTAELTVNYRTPARIMAVALSVLRANDPAAGDERPPTSVREGDHAPRAIELPYDRAAGLAAIAAEAAALVEVTSPGRTAVVTTAVARQAVTDALTAALPGRAGSGVEALDLPVAVLTTDQVKGLEFDAVLVVEPADILRASARGAHDLYVALTRPTQRLAVAHTGQLPPGFEQLATARTPDQQA